MTTQKQDPGMHQPSTKYISHTPEYMDQYRCKTNSKTILQVEDIKQQAKMVQQDMAIKGVLQHAHDVNAL